MSNFKLNITEIPSYLDGQFRLFKIKQTDDVNPKEYLQDTSNDVYFEELSISDRLRFEIDKREIDISAKIRIPQMKEINSLCVVKILDNYFKVYNAYHFTNKDGYKQTDLTLENYYNPVLEGEL